MEDRGGAEDGLPERGQVRGEVGLEVDDPIQLWAEGGEGVGDSDGEVAGAEESKD